MNKDELKQKTTAEMQALFTSNARGYDTFEKKIRDLIDQLDEPEKVVLPDFVFNHLEKYKDKGFSLWLAMSNGVDYELSDWMSGSNQELYARAWLAYPNIEVEKEPLYRARLKVITDEFIASYLRTQSSDAEDRLKALEIGSKYLHEDYRRLSEFTEDELKRLNIWGSEQWVVEGLEE